MAEVPPEVLPDDSALFLASPSLSEPLGEEDPAAQSAAEIEAQEDNVVPRVAEESLTEARAAAVERQRLAEQEARLSVLTEEKLALAAIVRQGREAVEGLIAQLLSARQRENPELCGMGILSGSVFALAGLITAAVSLAVVMAAWPMAVGIAAGGLVIGAVLCICDVGLYVLCKYKYKPPLPVGGQPSARCAVAPAVDLSEASSPGSVRVPMRVRRDESAPHVPAPAFDTPALLAEEGSPVASLRSR
jgi:hypothetical protein